MLVEGELCRSEGLPERDMESLGVMGWGLAVAENSSGVGAARRRRRLGGEGGEGGILGFCLKN